MNRLMRRLLPWAWLSALVVGLVLLASGFAIAQPAPCSLSMESARKKLPELSALPDDSFVRVVQEVYYPNVSPEQLALALCVKLPPPFMPPDLGMVDRWRYTSCQTNAAQAPTQQGVQVGLRLCREKFGQ